MAAPAGIERLRRSSGRALPKVLGDWGMLRATALVKLAVFDAAVRVKARRRATALLLEKAKEAGWIVC
jgi:hypothetical protein